MTKQFRNKITGVFLATLIFTLLAQPLAAKEKTEAVDQQALTILDRTTSFLAKQPHFSTQVEIWEDFAVSANTNVQFAETVNLFLRRPDHFRVEVATTAPEKTYFYNGKSVTYLDQRKGFYGTTAAPENIDETIEKMDTVYGLTVPLDDLLLSTPYSGSAAKANGGQYFGVEVISGTTCHHLAFQHDRIDWQVWIENGALPVVRKIVITRKTEPGSPQFIAQFDSWDFTTELPDYLFTFEPASEYLEIDIIETQNDKN